MHLNTYIENFLLAFSMAYYSELYNLNDLISNCRKLTNPPGRFETIMHDNKTVVVDYTYYQGRIDRLYLTKEGTFITKEGTPSRLPKAPLPNEGAFQVATIKLPPYIRSAQSEVLLKTVPHKRFTMRDIGCLLYTSPSPRDRG